MHVLMKVIFNEKHVPSSLQGCNPWIEVDGGVTPANAYQLIDAGRQRARRRLGGLWRQELLRRCALKRVPSEPVSTAQCVSAAAALVHMRTVRCC